MPFVGKYAYLEIDVFTNILYSGIIMLYYYNIWCLTCCFMKDRGQL